MSLITRCVTLLLAFATPVAAQHVQLSGWALPEGSKVCGSVAINTEAEVVRTDFKAPVVLAMEAEASACYDAFIVVNNQ
jgi:hypothetical protein